MRDIHLPLLQIFILSLFPPPTLLKIDFWCVDKLKICFSIQKLWEDVALRNLQCLLRTIHLLHFFVFFTKISDIGLNPTQVVLKKNNV